MGEIAGGLAIEIPRRAFGHRLMSEIHNDDASRFPDFAFQGAREVIGAHVLRVPPVMGGSYEGVDSISQSGISVAVQASPTATAGSGQKGRR